MDLTEEIHVGPIAAVDPVANVETNDPTVTPPLSPRAMMETFMTTQVAHGQLIEVAILRVDFAEYRGSRFRSIALVIRVRV